MSQKNKLDFSDFFPITTDQWKASILKELGLQKEEELNWNFRNIIFPKVSTSGDSAFPSLKNFHRHFILKSPRHWYTCEFVKVNKPAEANELALHALLKGADALDFEIQNANINIQYFEILLKDIYYSFSPIRFRLTSSLRNFCSVLSSASFEEMKGTLVHPIFNIEKDIVHYHHSLEEISSALQLIENIPQLRILNIQTTSLHQAAISPEIEIVYAIAAAIDLIDYLNARNFSTSEILSRMAFSFSVGKSFFVEIAKLRAFRYLWNEVVKGMNIETDSFSVPVHCTTAAHTFSEDPYYNILHNTTEALAAVTGGCDSLTILPFDLNQKEENAFSSRISRNISLLLKEEAYIAAVTDPSAGSYTLEQMTFRLAEKSLDLLRQIENKGGLSKAITQIPS